MTVPSACFLPARFLRWLGACVGVLLVAACAQAPRTPSTSGGDVWSGRLAITVDSTPPQRWSATFELEGAPQAGELRLFSPLGQTVAKARWTPNRASAQQGDRDTDYANMGELTEHLLGAAVPLDALFDWLKGQATPAAGWQLEPLAAGATRIVAERTHPLPQVQLRLVLDR